jgi:uncharacterized membrane protein
MSWFSLAQLSKATPGELILWFAILVVLTSVAAYAIGKIRAETLQREPTASELMSKFRELHSRGELSDAEFRTIKTTLAEQLRQQLKDNGDKA